MQKLPLSLIVGQVLDDLAGQTRTSGGSSDAEVTEFAAIPTGPFGPKAVTTVTPVGRHAKTRRKSVEVISATRSLPKSAMCRDFGWSCGVWVGGLVAEAEDDAGGAFGDEVVFLEEVAGHDVDVAAVALEWVVEFVD